MKRSIKWILFFGFVLGISQNAFKVDKFLESYQSIFNAKKFEQLENLMDEKFLKEVGKDNFREMNWGIYVQMGPIISMRRISDTMGTSRAWVNFENDELVFEVKLKGEKAEGFFMRNPYAFIADKKRSLPIQKSFTPAGDLDKFVDSVCSRFMEGERKCGLAVGIYHNGNRFEYYFGETSKGTGNIPNGQSLFEIGSVTKIFTAYLFAYACSQNILNPQMPLNRTLANMKIYTRGIADDVTLLHLTNHTSGLPRLPLNFLDQKSYSAKYPYRNYNRELLVQYLESAKEIKRKDNQQYSNLGLSVMGLILEHFMKMNYKDLVEKFIFPVCGMNNSYVHVKDAPTENLTTPYRENGKEATHFEFDVMAPAGSIVSCLPDMMNFVEKMRDSSGIPQKMMMTKTLGNNRFNAGMGWMIQPTGAKNTLVWHNGATFGYTSFAGFLREKDIYVVILNNQAAPVDKIAIDIIKYLEKKK